MSKKAREEAKITPLELPNFGDQGEIDHDKELDFQPKVSPNSNLVYPSIQQLFDHGGLPKPFRAVVRKAQ